MRYLAIVFIAVIAFSFWDDAPASTSGAEEDNTSNDYYPVRYTAPDYDDGHEWAEENNTDSFSDCDDEFGATSSDAEDGCNEYVKENFTGFNSFSGYPCTEDCSGHEAGYDWAEENDIYDSSDCNGSSYSFDEGCEAYVEDNYY